MYDEYYRNPHYGNLHCDNILYYLIDNTGDNYYNSNNKKNDYEKNDN